MSAEEDSREFGVRLSMLQERSMQKLSETNFTFSEGGGYAVAKLQPERCHRNDDRHEQQLVDGSLP